MTTHALTAQFDDTASEVMLTGTMVSWNGAVPPACADATGQYTDGAPQPRLTRP